MRLARAGEDEEALVQMDHPQLLQAMARILSDGGPKGDVSGAIEVRLWEFDLEEKRVEKEREEKRMENEMEIRARQLEIDREVHLFQLQTRQDTQTGDANATGLDTESRRAWDESLAGRTKWYFDTFFTPNAC